MGERHGTPDERERRAERLREALGLLERGTAAILAGAEFRRYLEAMGRFHQYSARNVLLIHAQRPDATRVAGYRTWQALGRQVRRGERGIRILVPYRCRFADAPVGEGDDDAPAPPPAEVVTGWGIGYVWDIAQTDGEPLPAPPQPVELGGYSDRALRLIARLEAFLAAEGVRVTYAETGSARGCYLPARRRVVVHARLTPDQTAKTLAHEAAHHVAVTRAVPEHGASRADVETIAEGAAYVVLHHAGLDASGYTFAYVARWAADHALLTRNLEAIRLTSQILLAAVAGLPGGPAYRSALPAAA